MPCLHDKDWLRREFQRRHLPPGNLRRLRRGLYREYLRYEEMGLDEATLAFLNEQCPLPDLKILRREDSQIDGASKLLLGTHDGLALETVIMRIGTGRVTICVSSQAGCSEKCSFCSTGRLGLARNLTSDEILAQILVCGRLLRPEGRAPRNVVFMGMGEPLRNRAAVEEAVERLVDQQSFSLSPSRVTVSSIGIPEAMLAFARRFPAVRMALSLHATNDELRTRLMPINQRHGLAELRSTLEQIERIRKSDIMISYLMIRDLNDRDEDALALLHYLEGLQVHVNLIPYNASHATDPFQRPADERVMAFQRQLTTAGLQVTRRYSLGQDIAAACGQLAAKSRQLAAKGRSFALPKARSKFPDDIDPLNHES